MLVVFWICNRLKAVDVIRGQFFSRIHCKVHLLAGELTGFAVNPRVRVRYVLIIRFWGMSVILHICGDSSHSLDPFLHSFLGLSARQVSLGQDPLPWSAVASLR